MFAFQVTKKDGKPLGVHRDNVATIEPVEGKPGKEAQKAQEARKAEPGVAAKFDPSGKVIDPGKPPVEALEAKPEFKALVEVPESAILHLRDGGAVPVLDTLAQLLSKLNSG
jgi:hypothetical protein